MNITTNKFQNKFLLNFNSYESPEHPPLLTPPLPKSDTWLKPSSFINDITLFFAKSDILITPLNLIELQIYDLTALF